jgi:hypothetical protein
MCSSELNSLSLFKYKKNKPSLIYNKMSGCAKDFIGYKLVTTNAKKKDDTARQ